MMFAVYAGFALAIDVSSALSLALRKGLAGFREPGPAMMSMPLVVQFLLLVALRVIIGRPVGAEGPLGLPRVRTGRSHRPP